MKQHVINKNHCGRYKKTGTFTKGHIYQVFCLLQMLTVSLLQAAQVSKSTFTINMNATAFGNFYIQLYRVWTVCPHCYVGISIYRSERNYNRYTYTFGRYAGKSTHQLLWTLCSYYTEASTDLKIAYGCIHIVWETIAEASTLIFYEKESEVYKVTVVGNNFYRLQTDAEWLKGLDDKTHITVEVMHGWLEGSVIVSKD